MVTVIKDATQVKSRKVRLVSDEGNAIVDKTEALAKANTDGLDLVLLQDGEIPVVKICDFAKIEYSKQKNVKTNRPKKPKQVQIGPYTQEYDLKRLAGKAEEFIQEGHPVSVKMEVKGRDRAFPELHRKKVKDFVAMIPNAKVGKLSEGSTPKSSVFSMTLS